MATHLRPRFKARSTIFFGSAMLSNEYCCGCAGRIWSYIEILAYSGNVAINRTIYGFWPHLHYFLFIFLLPAYFANMTPPLIKRAKLFKFLYRPVDFGKAFLASGFSGTIRRGWDCSRRWSPEWRWPCCSGGFIGFRGPWSCRFWITNRLICGHLPCCVRGSGIRRPGRGLY